MPPKIREANPGGQWVKWILLSLAIVCLCLLYFFNPVENSFYPVCQFHRLTGWNCPGCGMTRAAHALLHGDFPTALRDNVLFVLGVLALLVRAGWFALNRLRGKKNGEFFPARFVGWLLVLAVIFAVIRNLPAFSFLSP